MTTWVVIGVAALAALGLIVLAVALIRVIKGTPQLDGVEVETPEDDTTVGPDGACRSVQSATVTFEHGAMPVLWTPQMLERLGRTYWAYMSTFTLHIVRVFYTETERSMSLLFRPIKLITFDAPDYASTDTGGRISWRIGGGLLVSRAMRERAVAHLEIEVWALDPLPDGRERVHVEVEIQNFYPLFQNISPWLYKNTQSRIHVLLCYGFLRRLAQRDLEESVTGRFAE